ncbi:Ribonuclease/ribotoxin [Dichotomopilus funicola]|uniref:ribonuclease T1 n=1 Tax=Dichotomopilus funicola TaxID=1934379 RepID=A0AAN6ZM38_9PEZI|nr:Ribonuclease/ribotoxin [Dichotomopilus funicola]
MHLPALTLTLLAAAATVTANSLTPVLERRQGTTGLGHVTCGTTTYNKAAIDAAVAEGCQLYADRETLGSSKYPHRFNNREGLQFAVAGPYQEFPILSNGKVYSGRAPGADRIVFNPNYQGECVYVGAMTHTNAPTRNGFVECVEASGGGGGGSGGSTSSTRTTARPSTTVITGTVTTGTAARTSSASTSSSTGAAATQGLVGMGGQGVFAGVAAGLLLL